MTTELLADRRTMRYTCAVCDRCLEDGPGGLAILRRGDQSARHESGSLHTEVQGVEPVEPPPPPTLH